MELNSMIKDLLDSGIIENQEFALTLLNSDSVTKEEKMKFIEGFISDYTSGRVNFFSEDHKHIFNNWVQIYRSLERDTIKNRITRIE